MSPSGGGGDPGYTLPWSMRPRAGGVLRLGELTQEETRDLRSEPLSKSLGETLGEMLDKMRRQRTDDLAAAERLDLPRVDKTWRLAPTKAKQS